MPPVRRAAFGTVLLLAGLAGEAAGQGITPAFTYQGQIRSNGAPATGTYDLRFRLFDAASDGAQIGSTLCADNVAVTDGLFTVELDFSLVFQGQRRYLEIEARADAGAGCADQTGYAILSPRQELKATPYATFAVYSASATSSGTSFNAFNALQLGGQQASFYQSASNLTAGSLPGERLAGTYSQPLQFSNSSNVFVGSGGGLTGLNASNLSTGTLDAARLPIPLSLSGSTDSSVVWVANSSPVGRAVYGASIAPTGAARGAEFYVASTSGIGVSGYAGAGSGTTYGVWGGTASTSGRALYGEATAATGATAGVEARASSSSGAGVLSFATAATGTTYGVYTTNQSSQGRAVLGAALSGTGSTYGGEFYTASTSGIGVSGYAAAGSGTTYGVWGEGNSPGGYGGFFTSPGVGVRGASTGNDGVVATTSAPGRSGIWATNTATSGTSYGVAASSASPSGRGVGGSALATSGPTFGGYFDSVSPAGTGVAGFSNAASGSSYGVFGQAMSPDGAGVFGSAEAASGFPSGVYGRASSATGRGVYGLAAAFSGANHGGYFESRSTSGTGVTAIASAGSGTTVGLSASSASPSGAAVTAHVTSTTGQTYGVYARTVSADGIGVFGYGANGTGRSYGVYGRNDSTSGRAVYGGSGATTGFTYGGEFYAASNRGIGVSGYVDPSGIGQTYGVWGESTSDSTGYGVYGKASSPVDFNYGVVGDVSAPNGWAVYANGRFTASGTKSFRIDHPEDPEHKYLLHYCAEGPEPQNVYNGVVVLDERGEAEVTLPRYFAMINASPRYSLTALGAPMPMLHVAEEIREAAIAAGEAAEPGVEPPVCTFRIGGGAAGARVSWEVKAVRNDRFVRDRGAPVEMSKPPAEVGTFQHPELYKKGPERGMFTAPERTIPASVGPAATR